jgi:hypothetical protein
VAVCVPTARPEAAATTLLGVSVDFYVWRGPKLSADEFDQRLVDLDNLDVEEDSLFERSDRLPRFRREVLARYPALEDLDGNGQESPWAMTPVESDRFIEVNLHGSVTEEQVTFLFRRALYNGLYIYDPQNHEVMSPGPARWQILLRRIGLARLAGPDP